MNRENELDTLAGGYLLDCVQQLSDESGFPVEDIIKALAASVGLETQLTEGSC